MPTLASTLSFPFVLLLSVPLALFAVWTTTLALIILAVRVSVVYAELFAALLQTYLLPSTLPKSKSISSSSSTPVARNSPPSPASTRSSRSSSLGSGVLRRASTLQHRKSQSTATLVNSTIRDYEGVGGWRVQGEDEEEALWMGMNSRLQLPASRSQSHRRSGSWIVGLASGQVSPELARTPRVKTPVRGVWDEMGNPESYFLGEKANGGSRRVSFSFEDGKARSWAGSLVSLCGVGDGDGGGAAGGGVKVVQRYGYAG